MVDVQRNVIISLKLAGDPKNQAIADQVTRQAISAASQAEVAAKRTRDFYDRNEKGITEDKRTEADKRQDAAVDDFHKQEKAAKEHAKRLRDVDKVRVESTQKANESAVIAIQGMADMVEGAAKLGLVSEENFEKFAKNFVMIQEGIRVFKGATDVWWKGREALIALSRATKAQTAHNNLLAVSNLRVGATQAAGGAGGAAASRAGSGVAGNVAGGATGGAIATGGTALGGAAIVASTVAVATALAAAGAAVHDAVKYMVGKFVDLGEDSGTMSGALLGLRDAANQATEAAKKTTKALKDSAAKSEERDQWTSEMGTRLGLQSFLRASNTRVTEANSVARGETGIQSAERVRLEALKEIKAAEQELEDQQQFDQQRKEAGYFALTEVRLKLLKDQEDAHKRMYDADVNRLNVIRSQNLATEAALKSDRERLVTLQEQKRIETKGLNAKLGELNPGLQKMAIGVAEKIKAGKEELNLRDINILKEAGVGQEHIASYYEKKGKKAKGSDTFTEVFGSKQTKNDIADAQERADENRQKLIEGKKLENQAGQSVVSSANNLDQVTQARVKFEAELKLMFSEQVKGLQSSAQQIQQASADAADAIHQQSMATLSGIKQMQAEMVKSHQEMQKQFEQFQLHQNSYK